MDVVPSRHVSKPTSKSFPFFQLPRELRDYVYESVVTDGSYDRIILVRPRIDIDMGLRGSITRAQLLTNHQFHKELEHTFVRCAVIFLGNLWPNGYSTISPDEIHHATLLPGVLSNIRSAELKLCVEDYTQWSNDEPDMAMLEMDISMMERYLVAKVPGMRTLQLDLRNWKWLSVTQGIDYNWTEIKEEWRAMRSRWVRGLSQMDAIWESTTFLERLDFNQHLAGVDYVVDLERCPITFLMARCTRDAAIETFEQVCC
ncbi:hypothetical protein LTR28_005983 [Elasticomyces elasticus]|nr:hypothetical protein LTR28_005983 [Elasticomyces elasticus]